MRHKIEWLNRPGTTGATWNPVTGCTKISPGCKNCYAERMSKRLKGRFGYPADDPFAVTLHPDKLNQPLHWKKPRTVFVCSMGDLFHENVPEYYITHVFFAMAQAQAQHHTFIILTKRPKRMYEWFTYIATKGGEWLSRYRPNIIGMVTAENQKQADKRIPWLLRTPFAVRGVSVEPCLEEINLRLMSSDGYRMLSRWYGPDGFDENGSQPAKDQPKPDWIVCGAETGPGARPMYLGWARNLRDQCKSAGVPFFFKRTSPGTETPPDLEVREWPNNSPSN